MKGDPKVGLELYLIRHAKTEKCSESGKDFDRTLMPKGRQQAKLLADYLESKRCISVLLCSTARRTQETKNYLCKKLKFETFCDTQDLYLANHLDILKLICQQKGSKTICIIGHNDGISDLASYLTGSSVHLKTSGYLCLRPTIEAWDHLTANSCLILDAFRPEILE